MGVGPIPKDQIRFLPNWGYQGPLSFPFLFQSINPPVFKLWELWGPFLPLTGNFPGFLKALIGMVIFMGRFFKGPLLPL